MLIDEKILSSYVIIFPHESVINYFKTHYYNIMLSKLMQLCQENSIKQTHIKVVCLDDRYCDMINHKLQPN